MSNITNKPFVGQPGVTYRDCIILGFPGYKVGDDGSVWSGVYPRGNGEWKKLTPTPGRRGHLFVKLCTGIAATRGMQLRMSVSRLVYAMFNGPIPAGLLVRHHPDPTPSNNRPGNLRIGTYADNARDMIEHGRSCTGEKHYRAKLTEQDVLIIRALCSVRIPQSQIAQMFGISLPNISCIHRRFSWRHLQETNMANVVITIADGGETEIRVSGHAGPGCKDLTRAIEKALGTVTSDQKTGEFYHQQTAKQQAKAGSQ